MLAATQRCCAGSCSITRLPLILQTFVIDLPCSRTSHDQLEMRLVAAQDGVGDETPEFGGIDRLTLAAVSKVGDL